MTRWWRDDDKVTLHKMSPGVLSLREKYQQRLIPFAIRLFNHSSCELWRPVTQMTASREASDWLHNHPRDPLRTCRGCWWHQVKWKLQPGKAEENFEMQGERWCASLYSQLYVTVWHSRLDILCIYGPNTASNGVHTWCTSLNMSGLSHKYLQKVQILILQLVKTYSTYKLGLEVLKWCQGFINSGPVCRMWQYNFPVHIALVTSNIRACRGGRLVLHWLQDQQRGKV